MADLHLSGDRFHIRPAKKEDAEAMTGVYYNSEALDITAMPKTAEVPNTHAIHQVSSTHPSSLTSRPIIPIYGSGGMTPGVWDSTVRASSYPISERV